ncbi:hypothetical protein Tco_1194885 [Tanacetum coccineum]
MTTRGSQESSRSTRQKYASTNWRHPWDLLFNLLELRMMGFISDSFLLSPPLSLQDLCRREVHMDSVSISDFGMKWGDVVRSSINTERKMVMGAWVRSETHELSVPVLCIYKVVQIHYSLSSSANLRSKSSGLRRIGEHSRNYILVQEPPENFDPTFQFDPLWKRSDCFESYASVGEAPLMVIILFPSIIRTLNSLIVMATFGLTFCDSQLYLHSAYEWERVVLRSRSVKSYSRRTTGTYGHSLFIQTSIADRHKYLPIDVEACSDKPISFAIGPTTLN